VTARGKTSSIETMSNFQRFNAPIVRSRFGRDFVGDFERLKAPGVPGARTRSNRKMYSGAAAPPLHQP